MVQALTPPGLEERCAAALAPAFKAWKGRCHEASVKLVTDSGIKGSDVLPAPPKTAVPDEDGVIETNYA